MPIELEPTRRFVCTYDNCVMSFDSEREMKRHKRTAEEHDYCQKCDEDFPGPEEFVLHKALRPDNHGKACRVCGEEFKSLKGLQRHIELNHGLDQKLNCIACGDEFHRASLLIEHLEFGHCKYITASQFMAHITHKFLIAELLKGGLNFDRFTQKTSRFNAAVDLEEEGGVNIIDDNDHGAQDVEIPAIKPEIPAEAHFPVQYGQFPPLQSQDKGPAVVDPLTGEFKDMSIGENAPTVAGSSATSVSGETPSIWGGNTSRTLFPKAASSVAPSETSWSVEQLDREKETEYGINILTTRFWDPDCDDWNPDRFFDPMSHVYYCPFVCEQSFAIPPDLAQHIRAEHRIRQMKCPACLKQFRSCTALVAHCESRGTRCKINKAENYSTFMDKLTGGFLGVDERLRPDHEYNPTVMITNPETGRVERYRPPQAYYQQYSVTKPADYKEPKSTFEIGGGREKA